MNSVIVQTAMATGKVVLYIVLCAVVLAAGLEVTSTSNDINKQYHGSHNPNIPTGVIGDFTHKGHHGHHKPQLENEGSEESYGHHHHHHDSHHHRHQPQPPTHEELQILQEFEKRRPFYPLVPHVPHYPYYPHYPHNENEDSGSIEQLIMRLLLHPPSFPLNNDNRESIKEHRKYGFYGPFYHGPHNPHIPAFPKGPNSDEPVEGSGDSETDRETVQLTNIPGVLHKDDDVTEYESYDDLEEAQLDEAVAYVNRNRLTEPRVDHVECDYLNTPRYSCYSCYTYLDCKQGGGKIKQCKDPFLPYCNNGVCSATPTAQCEPEGYEVDASEDGEIVLLTNIAKNIPLQDENVTKDESYDDLEEALLDEAVSYVNRKRLTEPRSDHVECDYLNTPRYSCFSCYTYLECKQGGGKIKPCKDPFLPYCNNGVCSATPTAQCEPEGYEVDASGDGEIVPLTNIAKNIPLQDDDETENEDQQEKTREVTAFGLKRLIQPRPSFEVKCDSSTTTKSCYSCYHTMVCTSNVGTVNACTDTSAPYCKNGRCSATPNTGCSRL